MQTGAQRRPVSTHLTRPAGSFWNEFRRLDNGFHEFSSTPNIYKAHFRPENTSTISFCRHPDSDRPGAVRIPVNTNCLFTSHTALNNAQTTEKSEVRGQGGRDMMSPSRRRAAGRSRAAEATRSGDATARRRSCGGGRGAQARGYAPETRPTSRQHQLQPPKQAAPTLSTAPAAPSCQPVIFLKRGMPAFAIFCPPSSDT